MNTKSAAELLIEENTTSTTNTNTYNAPTLEGLKSWKQLCLKLNNNELSKQDVFNEYCGGVKYVELSPNEQLEVSRKAKPILRVIDMLGNPSIDTAVEVARIKAAAANADNLMGLI